MYAESMETKHSRSKLQSSSCNWWRTSEMYSSAYTSRHLSQKTRHNKFHKTAVLQYSRVLELVLRSQTPSCLPFFRARHHIGGGAEAVWLRETMSELARWQIQEMSRISMVRLISLTYAASTRAPYDSSTAMKRLLHALRGITNPTADSYHWEACHTLRHSSASLIKARESLLALKVP